MHQRHVVVGVRARSRLPKRPLRSRGVTSVTSVTPLQRTCLQRGQNVSSVTSATGFRGLQISGDRVHGVALSPRRSPRSEPARLVRARLQAVNNTHGTPVCWAAFGSLRPAIARPPSLQRQPFSTPICKEWSGSELGGPQRSRPDWPFREVVGLDLGAPSSRAGGGRRRQQGRGLHRQAASGAQGLWAEQVDDVLEAHLDAAVLRDHNVSTNVPRLVATSTSEAGSALTKNRTVAANSLPAGTGRESPDKSSSPPQVWLRSCRPVCSGLCVLLTICGAAQGSNIRSAVNVGLST